MLMETIEPTKYLHNLTRTKSDPTYEQNVLKTNLCKSKDASHSLRQGSHLCS